MLWRSHLPQLQHGALSLPLQSLLQSLLVVLVLVPVLAFSLLLYLQWRWWGRGQGPEHCSLRSQRPLALSYLFSPRVQAILDSLCTQ